jgi:hypothetical protein
MSSAVLPACPAGAPATQVFASVASVLSRKVEPVGRAYQQTKHKAITVSTAADDAIVAPPPSSSPGPSLSDPKYGRYKKFDIDNRDYYTLLGLEDKMFDATKDEITEAYRRICKVIHPVRSHNKNTTDSN